MCFSDDAEWEQTEAAGGAAVRGHRHQRLHRPLAAGRQNRLCQEVPGRRAPHRYTKQNCHPNIPNTQRLKTPLKALGLAFLGLQW